MELFPCPSLRGTGASRSGGRRHVSRAVPATRALRRNAIVREGAGNLKAIIWTMILVAFVYAAVMVIPVLINEYEFQDSLQNIARFASVNRKNNEQVKQAVLEEAQKEDLPVQAEDIKVEGSAGKRPHQRRLFRNRGPESLSVDAELPPGCNQPLTVLASEEEWGSRSC